MVTFSKEYKGKVYSCISYRVHLVNWSLWMPELEVTQLTSCFKKIMPVKPVIMVTAVNTLSLERDFDISLVEWIYSLDKAASRMTTALL